MNDDYEPSAGAGYLLGSMPLVIVGAVLVSNLDEDPALLTIAILCLALAAYLLVVGAVARGIQVGHRRVHSRPDSAKPMVDGVTSAGPAGASGA